MITFLPYPDFRESAKCLDYKRLGKQRLEARQILEHLINGNGPWWNHPAIKQWFGFERTLASYGIAICEEWIHRGYVDNQIKLLITLQMKIEPAKTILSPWWMGDERLHSSHRSNLLRKNPEWYGKFGWKESPDLPYFWPV